MKRVLLILLGVMVIAAVVVAIAGPTTGLQAVLADRQGASVNQPAIDSPLGAPTETAADRGVFDSPLLTPTMTLQVGQSPLSTPTATMSAGASPLTIPDAISTPVFVADSLIAITDTMTVSETRTASVTVTTGSPVTITVDVTGTETVSDVESSRAPIGSTLAPTAMPSTPGRPANPVATQTVQPVRYTYEVVNEFAHDSNAFTQGLQYVGGILYEGTGMRGQSDLRKVDLATGEVLSKADLPDNYFGEGVTVLDGKVYQLTWQSNKGHIYDANDLTKIGEFTYPTEGWGLTHDGQRLIMSDGSSYLYFRDPVTFEELGRVQVTGPNGPVERLNELEYINGYVFANVWQTNYIVRIDPTTGQIIGVIDLTGLLSQDHRTGRVDVLNGIAYDAAGRRLFVTGKWWPRLYQIKLKEMP